MTEKKNNHKVYISDSGLMEDNNTKQAHLFIFLCNILTAVLAVIGLIAFVQGNF